MKKSVKGLQKGQKLGRRYPWDDWLKRPSFTLVQGIDYLCMPHGMAQMIRCRAHEKGLKVSIKITEGQLDITLTKEQLHA